MDYSLQTLPFYALYFTDEEFLLKVRFKDLPVAQLIYFFFLYYYDDCSSFPFSNHCLKKENLQEHFTFVPSPWQSAQPQYDASKPFPQQTHGFHNSIILYGKGGRQGRGIHAVIY